MQLTADTLSRPLRAPFASAHGTVTDRPLVLVTLHAADGMTGHGEAAPLESYDGVSVADVLVALDACRPVLAALSGTCAGRRRRRPLCRGDHGRAGAGGDRPGAVGPRGPTDAPADLAPARRRCRSRAGPRSRSTGRSPPRTDPARRRRRPKRGSPGSDRQAEGRDRRRRGSCLGGPRVRRPAAGDPARRQRRLGYRRGAAALRALEPSGIELCEEPVHGLAEFAAAAGADGDSARARRVGRRSGALDGATAIRLPEGLTLRRDRRDARGRGDRARAAGYEVYLASTLDGPLGIAAALHCAAVMRPAARLRPGTLGMFAGRGDPLPARDGAIAVRAARGSETV